MTTNKRGVNTLKIYHGDTVVGTIQDINADIRDNCTVCHDEGRGGEIFAYDQIKANLNTASPGTLNIFELYYYTPQGIYL